ncbi:MAG: NADH-quinone oxidoreductase subunit J [Nitrososphaerota archaeon]|uniref:NADH-quinone oxidoreductase subunit J n=1 Tax=Desulfurococcus sp. TaxID=51678 RepID=UPI001777B888|nr:NADH-quinone oxidoreductase subunit J [Candidatus Geocrenenecus dongiae]
MIKLLMSLEIVEASLLVMLVIFSIIAVESENLVRSVLALLGFIISLSIIFILLYALHVGLILLLIYAGGAVALLMIVIMMTKGREE